MTHPATNTYLRNHRGPDGNSGSPFHTGAANAGRVLTQERLLRRVWGPEYPDDPRLLYTYIFTEPRVGYRMARP